MPYILSRSIFFIPVLQPRSVQGKCMEREEARTSRRVKKHSQEDRFKLCQVRSVFFRSAGKNMQKSLSFSMASPVLQLSHSVQCVVYMWQGPRKDRARILPRKWKGFPRHFSKQVSRDPEELTWNSQGGKGLAQRQLPRRYGSHPHDLRDPSL